jgi:hypothetical protein
MLASNEHAPITYPRTAADEMIEFAESFPVQLAQEPNLVGLARHEDSPAEPLSNDPNPRYLRTAADIEAEAEADKAWARLYPSEN